MNEIDGAKPKAFVVMPFADGFDEIYSLFIHETMSKSGFDVCRADDIASSQNILKDIVRAIAESDLVVADLTDSNPNVYYELGLAHALGRPVILLAQNIDDLPFDLRSYRVIPYKTHFATIAAAREQLETLATGFLTGKSKFGSPASDFLGLPVNPWKQTVADSSDSAGLLDHLADIEEGFENLGSSVSAIGDQTRELTEKTTRVTARINELNASPHGRTARELRTLVAQFAQRLAAYSRFVATENEKYRSELESTRTALESIVRSKNPRTQSEREELEKMLTSLETARTGTESALRATSRMADSLRNIPGFERNFNRSRKRAVEEIEHFGENIEQTVSMLSRAKEIAQQKIASSTDEGQ
jgi:hypothetical protein